MNLTDFMDGLPLWGVFLLSEAIILLSLELGFQLGKRMRSGSEGKGKIQTGPVVAASLGLLAFMLAFTFGAVTSQYDERKQLVLDEANAIGTAYLRADLLPEADRAEVQRLLHEYVSLRIGMAQSGAFHLVNEGIERSEILQADLWSKAVAIADQKPTPTIALFVSSLNEVIDLHQKRVTVALHHRMPGFFWKVLYGLALLAMLVAGYDLGASGGRRSITTLLTGTLAFSVVMLLVVALDRPGTQLSIVDQAALVDLEQDFRRSID